MPSRRDDPEAEFAGPLLGPPKNGHSFSDRMDSRLALVWSRASIFIISFMVTAIILPGGIWFANHMVDQQNAQADALNRLTMKSVELNQQMLNIVSAQLQNSKNLQDRIEYGEKQTNERIAATNELLRLTSIKLDEIAKIVYQNMKAR